MLTACQHCSAPLPPRPPGPGRPRLYCSPSCSNAASLARTRARGGRRSTCAHPTCCNLIPPQASPGRLYCNDDCRADAVRPPRRRRRPAPCAHPTCCNLIPPTAHPARLYCDDDCRSDARDPARPPRITDALLLRRPVTPDTPRRWSYRLPPVTRVTEEPLKVPATLADTSDTTTPDPEAPTP